MIPIPTGDLFMPLYFTAISHKEAHKGQKEFLSFEIPYLCFMCLLWLLIAAGESRNHRDELARADRFGDMHLIARRECLTAVCIPGVGS